MKNLLYIISTIIFLLSCSRFEEGPEISFRSINARVMGTYVVEKYSVNGTDHTQEFCQDSAWVDSVKYYFDHLYHDDVFFAYDEGQTVYGGKGGWYKNEKKILLSFGFSGQGNDPNLPEKYQYKAIGNLKRWQLVRLKRREMWIKVEYEGNEHKVQLRKIRTANGKEV